MIKKELLRGVWLIIDPASIGQCVVHGEFLLQVPDLPLVFLQQDCGVQTHVDRGLVDHLANPRCEFKRGNGLFQVRDLGPDVADEHRLAVAPDRVL